LVPEIFLTIRIGLKKKNELVVKKIDEIQLKVKLLYPKIFLKREKKCPQKAKKPLL